MVTTHFVVLGGGLVGSFIARQLAEGEAAAVTLVDRDKQALKRAAALAPVNICGADLRDPEAVAKAVTTADIVVGALPGNLGYQALEAVIRTGKPCVDISFFPEDVRELDELARRQGVPAIVDCGVMPGLGGMLAAELAGKLEDADSASIMVGGLPVERRWPLEYRAPFSPIDVIEEYTRPARLRQGGELVVRPALSDVELVHFAELGTLEAFNTDGLRSLLHTLELPNLSEKTLRYPGHAERVLLLKELGFFSEEKLRLTGGEIAPIELTSRLLIDAWQLEHGMLEFTIMRVEVTGQSAGRPCTLRCELLDRTDPVTGDFSMARTTGWPAILVARELAAGNSSLRARSGVIFPEQLVAETGVYPGVIAGLAAAGINLKYRTL
ncbi:saccharopine dehydrogenase NADP-binding domain-containing protein [bacterium]|nr:saccharopine dehydrogenase NADP-binding domain-containing protein [bacterium]